MCRVVLGVCVMCMWWGLCVVSGICGVCAMVLYMWCGVWGMAYVRYGDVCCCMCCTYANLWQAAAGQNNREPTSDVRIPGKQLQCKDRQRSSSSPHSHAWGSCRVS